MVHSSQAGPHPRLARAVDRALATRHRAPPPSHQLRAWAQLARRIEPHAHALILDLGCGTGESSARLARAHPDHLVLGVDKSEARLARAPSGPENLILVRMDAVWLWRLAAQAGIRAVGQFLLYPNPWPKPGHLGRRWHGHPVFRELLEVGGHLELRTNWGVYALEMGLALARAGAGAGMRCGPYLPAQEAPDPAISPFERKYLARGERLFRLRCPQLRASSSSSTSKAASSSSGTASSSPAGAASPSSA